ncbi:MAG TPA: signal peptidase II [Clostridiales bacterium]|nr:signal peptidase II [Clostridiales bacterium]
MAYLLLIIGVVGLDQCAKWIVQMHLDLYGSVKMWGFLKLTYIQNTGAAFGILDGNRFLFVLFTLTLCVFMLAVWKKPWMQRYHLSAALIIAGAIGNSIDRVFRGYVVDFIDLSFFPAIFNVADIAVCCGTVLLALLILFSKEGFGLGEKETEK